MISTDRLVAAVTERLALAGCVAAGEEAVDLVAAAPDAPTLDAWVGRREQGEPPAWITSAHRFGDRVLRVESGVYVPRWQSEELAQRAARVLPRHGRAIDLCTGAGAVAAYLTAAVPTAAVTGVDLDVRAAACARRNGVATVVADVTETLPLHCGADVVTAVAPYVPSGEIGLLPADVQRFEPRRALDGGADGLDVVRQVVAAAERLLRPGGWLLVEVGGAQDALLAPTLAAHGFATTTPWWDEDGDLRGVAARAAGTTP